MKVLIDTHILIWWLYNSTNIKKKHYQVLEDSDNEIFVSTASILEIAIKKGISKISIPHRTSELIENSGFKELPIKVTHTDFIETILWKHKDPFDKIIISQAISDNLQILSYDGLFSLYDLKLLK